MKRSSHFRAAILGLLLVLVFGLGPGPSLARSPATQADPAPAANDLSPVPADPSLPAVAGADADWWSAVQDDIRRSEYFVTWQDETYLADLPAAYQAPNRAHNLRTYFAEQGPVVIPRVWTEELDAPPWRWQGQLVAWGRPGALGAISPAALAAAENRIEYQRGTVLEWYRNDEEGLVQGFTLLSPPGDGQGQEPLQIDLALGGDLAPEMAIPGAEIDFRTPDGNAGLRYGGLWAADARGEPLPAWLAVEDATLSLLVDDSQAVYPIDVETILTGLPTDADWSLPFGQLGAGFGLSAATAGDVDGDGYSEVIIGAPYFDSGLIDQGGAFVYYGFAGGLYDFADWIETIGQAGAHFGRSVATAGDVNGDGYADVIVGAPDYTNGQTGEGGTWVYHGAYGSGLRHEPATHDEGNKANAAFGQSVATAGDVNGDGYSDVIVGAPLYNNGQSEEGMVWVWHGSENGLSDLHNWHAQSNQVDGSFGQSVATAGDVNGDGYADIIVGATRYTSGQTWEGAAFVWLGSEFGVNGGVDGDPTNEHRHLQINQDYARFGWSVSTAGDVDGDGFSDVIVGAPYYTNGQAYEGGAWLYLGSDTGLSASWANQDEGNQNGAHFGSSVGLAGDVNGDGRADVIVGAPDYGANDEGRAWLWYGQDTEFGISTLSDWTVTGEQADGHFGTSVFTAGDVDGDGYSDVIVGAPSTDSPPGEGVAYVYHGSPEGLEETSIWIKPSNQDHALFGTSVGTAGDVNGDGYADVIVGAPLWDGGVENEGAAWVYLGSASGPVSAPHWYRRSNLSGAQFGAAVATAGDVNGDGYDDVIVGAPYWHNPPTDEGAAFVYHGSSSGLSETAAPLWSKRSNQAGAEFGTSVGTAGDVNGDGYADIIVGAPFWRSGGVERGGVWLYYGSDGGPHSAPDWYTVGDQEEAQYGYAVATAGDVNGDGYSDAIVGAPYWEDDANNEGRAWVYLGSARGLRYDLHWHAESNQPGARMGFSVGTAGDVDGDGYSDVIVSAPNWGDGGLSSEGRVWVFHGSATGLEAAARWHKESGQNGAQYGYSAETAGDVNGDGYADVILGAPLMPPSSQGAARVFFGSFAGLGDEPWRVASDQTLSWFGQSVSTAGDVNGDGYADIIIGAPQYNVSLVDEGKIFLYYGNGSRGLSLNPRQARATSSVPIAHLGWSDSMDALRIYTRLQTPFGRGRLQQQVEIKPLGVPLDGTHASWWGYYDNPEPGVDHYMAIGNLAAGTLYHWRVRLRYDPVTTPWMPASRWLTMPWNGWNEADFRTAGSRVLLPAVLKNHD